MHRRHYDQHYIFMNDVVYTVHKKSKSKAKCLATTKWLRQPNDSLGCLGTSQVIRASAGKYTRGRARLFYYVCVCVCVCVRVACVHVGYTVHTHTQ